MEHEMLQILGWLLGLTLFLMFFVAYRRYRVDRLRYRLFIIRDELFKAAECGKIDFNSEAYGIARLTVNGLLRFAHTMSLFRLVMIAVSFKLGVGKEAIAKYRDDFREAVEELDYEEKRIILRVHALAHIEVLLHLAHTSFLLAWWMVPLLWVLKSLHKTGIIKRRVISGKKARKRWSVIDGGANYFGERAYG